MYVKVTGDNSDRMVHVLGEPLDCHMSGHYLLPGRLVNALKLDDLPTGIGFSLLGPLPSGYGFYREDVVVFRRSDDAQLLCVEVTSIYDVAKWDGLFPLETTLLARKQVIDERQDLTCVLYETDASMAQIKYEFSWEFAEEHDLESVLEAICDTVCEVEGMGNARLWPGRRKYFEGC